MANIDTTRVLFSVVVNQDWLLHQFDVKIVFFYLEIEEVNKEAPQKGEGCKFKKSSYGLKQSPRP